MKKKAIALLMTGVMLAMTACASTGAAPAAAPAEDAAAEAADESAPAEEGKTYNVGICQLVQHVALDAATKGFRDALTEKLGDRVTFDEQNAAGDTATATTICNNLVAENVDLILANATPALQSAAAATNTIPILGTAITEYGVALDIDGFDGTVGGNISGTSDLAPLDAQAAMVSELFPDAKTVGIVYCSAEPNSKYQADTVEKYLQDAGLTVTIYTFADSNDIASVMGEACANNEVLYIPTDNTAASCTEAINNVAQPAGVPIICGEEGLMSGCGVATLSIDYYGLGYTTGEMAVMRFLRTARTSPPWRSSIIRIRSRSTIRPSVKHWASPFRMITQHLKPSNPGKIRLHI